MFLDYIKLETEKALKERNYLIKEIKARERRGSIFIDKVKKVVAAVQREGTDKFDYLIDWEFNKGDKITPSSSIVRGSHFVFSHPLHFRKYVESNFIAKGSDKDSSRIVKNK
jgi:hypothetical protein